MRSFPGRVLAVRADASTGVFEDPMFPGALPMITRERSTGASPRAPAARFSLPLEAAAADLVATESVLFDGPPEPLYVM